MPPSIRREYTLAAPKLPAKEHVEICWLPRPQGNAPYAFFLGFEPSRPRIFFSNAADFSISMAALLHELDCFLTELLSLSADLFRHWLYPAIPGSDAAW